MVQKLIYRLMVLAVLAGMVCSCSKLQEEYSNAIPADADFVSSVRLNALSRKAGMNDEANQALIGQLSEAIKGEVKSTTAEQLETLFRNPDASGIDFEEPLFFFMKGQGKKGGMVAKVKDNGQLKEVVETLLKESDGELELQSESGLSYVLLDKKAILAFTPTTLLVYTEKKRDNDILKEAKALLTQEHENSLASKTLFARLQNAGGDIALATTADLLMQNGRAPFLPSDPETLFFSVGLSFEKGEVNLDVEGYTEDEAWKNFIEKQSKMSRPISNQFLKFFPKSTLALISFGIDGPELYKSLEENNVFAMGIEEEDQALFQEICGALQGDITIGVTDFGLNSFSILALTESQSSETLQKLSRRLQEVSGGYFAPEREGDNYTVRIERMNYAYGLHNKKFYVTNDTKIQKSLGESLTASAADTRYASEIKGKNSAVIVNGQAIMELPLVKMGLSMLGNPSYADALGGIDYLRITGEEMTCRFNLQLKDKKTNALKQIVDAARELGGM